MEATYLGNLMGQKALAILDGQGQLVQASLQLGSYGGDSFKVSGVGLISGRARVANT